MISNLTGSVIHHYVGYIVVGGVGILTECAILDGQRRCICMLQGDGFQTFVSGERVLTDRGHRGRNRNAGIATSAAAGDIAVESAVSNCGQGIRQHQVAAHSIVGKGSFTNGLHVSGDIDAGQSTGIKSVFRDVRQVIAENDTAQSLTGIERILSKLGNTREVDWARQLVTAVKGVLADINKI